MAVRPQAAAGSNRGQHMHTEAFPYLCHGATEFAPADDAEREALELANAMQGGTKWSAPGPGSIDRQPVIGAEMLRQMQNHAPDMLCNRGRAVAAHVAYADAALGGAPQIDIVGSGAGQRDQAQ